MSNVVTVGVAVVNPDIEVVLNVRSYERVVVVSGSGLNHDYPEHWEKLTNEFNIDNDTVVVIDAVDVSHDTLSAIALMKPRMIAFVPFNAEQEKSMRRMVSSLYPWAMLWAQLTTFGKILYSNEITGQAYNRDELVDMSNAGAA